MKLALFQHGAHVVRAPVGDARVPKGLQAGRPRRDGPRHRAAHHARHAVCRPPDGLRERPTMLALLRPGAGRPSGRLHDAASEVPRHVPAVRRTAATRRSQFRARLRRADIGLTGKGATVAITDAYASPTIASDANKLRHAARRPRVRARPASRQCIPPKPLPGNGPCGAHRLVRRGDARRRGRARDGARREHPLLRGARPAPTTDFLDVAAPGRRRQQGRRSSPTPGATSSNETPSGIAPPTSRSSSRAPMQGIGFMFSSGDDGDEVRRAAGVQTDYPASDPWVTAVGGTAHRDRRRRRAALADRLGHPEVRPVGQRQELGPAFTPPFLYGSGRRLLDAVQPARLPGRRRPRRRRPAGRSRTSALDGDPTTGMLVGRDADVPERRSLRRVPHRRDQPRRRRSSPACQALAAQAAGSRLGFANPTIYALARERRGRSRTSSTTAAGTSAPTT